MRRYVYHKEHDCRDAIQFDVVVVGCGMAALYAILNLDPSFSVALVSKGSIESGSSWLAQGGISGVMSADDDVSLHVADTLRAGAGHCDPEAVKVLCEEGPENLRRLIELEVPFDRDDGVLHITREGGHSRNRILHCGGDSTGREVTKRMGELVFTKHNVELFFGSYLVDIVTSGSKARGVIINRHGSEILLMSRNIIIATGGIGQLYKYTTTPVGCLGDGIAACHRAGVMTEDMEFVQFHPTGFAKEVFDNRVFLISEAVRGEGGILRNKHGEAFMKDVHEMADLAPRDIVTRAILKEMRATDDDKVYLDVSSMSEEFFTTRFPTITNVCRREGINVPYDPIPVRPTQHYFMGGIKTGLNGETSIDGLYACGETACTRVHGANRLASNSTLECLVFGRRAAVDINNNFRHSRINEFFEIPLPAGNAPLPDNRKILEIIERTRTIMTDKVGAVRTVNELKSAVTEIDAMLAELEKCQLTTKDSVIAYNALTVASLIAKSALFRPESMGAHYITVNKNII